MSKTSNINSYSCPQFRETILREESARAARSEFYRDVISGLSQPTKSIPSKYFYDTIGSEIYTRITQMKSYYLTAAEREILSRFTPAIIDNYILPQSDTLNVVELGAGDGRKTTIFLRALLQSDVQFEYLPIDISAGAMTMLFNTLRATFSDHPLHVHGIVSDYATGLEYAQRLHPGRRTIVLFLGSSIGNFAPKEATTFLAMLGSRLKDRDLLLLGSDLKKNPALLQAAYADYERVTEKFNLNLLTRMNRQLGADFDTTRFHHHAIYDPVAGCMKSFLLSREAQTVRLRGLPDQREAFFSFAKWEPLFTEHSFKYDVHDVHSSLSDAGFLPIADYSDSQGWFLDTMAAVRTSDSR